MTSTPSPEAGPASEQAERPAAETNESAAPACSLLSVVRCLTAPAGLVSAELVDHNTLVACIAGEMATVLGLSVEEREAAVLAGLLHDVGAIATELPLSDLRTHAQTQHDGHAQIGAQFIAEIEALREVAPLVNYHHHAWARGAGEEDAGLMVPEAANLLHLCDAVALRADPRRPNIEQPNQICRAVHDLSDSLLRPQHVEAFLDLATQAHFWRESVTYPAARLDGFAGNRSVQNDGPLLRQIATTFSQITDLRCGAATTHGISVGTIAAALGALGGWSEGRVESLRVAGYVHDIGQLAVPVVLLTRPEQPSEEEWSSMRAHAHLACRVLGLLDGFEEISLWVAHHHERLDGTGYPERLQAAELPHGSRILAVADAYAAMTEDRPYSSGRPAHLALAEMQVLARDRQFDADIVGLLGQHLVEIEARRLEAQMAAVARLTRLQHPRRPP